MSDTIATETLADVVRSLTPPEQDAVRRFIDDLRRSNATAPSQSAFVEAADEFIEHHQELLHRLAQ